MSETTLGQRLKEARLTMQPSKMSQAALGKAIAKSLKKTFSASAVGQWELDRVEPERLAIIEFAKITGADVVYLFLGVRSDQLGWSGRLPRGGRVVHKVSISPKEPAIKRLNDVVHTHFPCSEKAYLLEVFDSRNAPTFARGDHIVIDPEVEPEPGDMVLAMVNAAPLFGVFSREGGLKVESVDRKWGVEEIDSRRGDSILGVMTEHARPRRH